ncbi:MAG: hypothetical protein WBC91_12840 [Phototrophicaceae bacterium]
MSRIMEAWQLVLREAVSNDYDEQQFALHCISMVLQRHNPHLGMDSDAEEEALSRELLRLTLNHEKQAETVDYLVALIKQKPNEAESFLYGLSTAQPIVLAEPLVKLLLDVGSTFKKKAIFQALIALDSVVKYADDSVATIFDTYDLIPLLDDWADHEDDLIANKADVIADRILDLLDDDEEEDE